MTSLTLIYFRQLLRTSRQIGNPTKHHNETFYVPRKSKINHKGGSGVQQIIGENVNEVPLSLKGSVQTHLEQESFFSPQKCV